jgi:IS605 OrfB family transposase
VILTAEVRLNPDQEQARALLATLERANECANWISAEAWKRRTFSRFALHRLLYREARQRFGLSAQVVVRLFAKVADAYKKDKKVERRFARQGAIAYDARILTFGTGEVSIWTIAGKRMKVGYSAGSRQSELLRAQHGESDLSCRAGKFYLLASCKVEDPKPAEVDDLLGVDLGVVNIATDSDGNYYSGSMVNNVRFRHRKLRKKLQTCGSKSAKRHLKRLSGKEKRFARNINHVIAKQVVALAEGTRRGIAVEELTGIRGRITAGRKKRAILHCWSFGQLRGFLEYKAQRAGVLLLAVDPRNSSRECSCCGYTHQSNRPSQSSFRCGQCGYTAHADLNAAQNLRSRANRQLANRGALAVASGDFQSQPQATSF